MKHALALTVFLSIAPVASEALEFRLQCVNDTTKEVLPIEVIKTPYMGKDGKWQAHYAVEVATPGSESVRLAPRSAGDGDEDYLSYNVVKPRAEIDINGVTIQNEFAWASLIDNNGSDYATCKKKK